MFRLFVDGVHDFTIFLKLAEEHMQRLKGSEITVARRAIDKAFEEHDAALGGIRRYAVTNINEPALVNDPQFTGPYLRMQQIMRSGWTHHGSQMDSILDAVRALPDSSPTEIERVQEIFDTWDGSPQHFIDRLKAECALARATLAGEDGSRPGDDLSP
jgi:hypothetical protein